MRWVLGVTFAGCLCACATTAQKPGDEPSPLTQSPAAQRQSPLRTKVEAMLAHSTPLPAEEWRHLGPEALAVLQQIANDPGGYPDLRIQALTAIAWVDSPDVRTVLEGYARDAHQAAPLRSAALEATLLLPVAVAPNAAIALVEDPSPLVRQAASKVLGRAGGPGAREALESRLEHEEDSAVRQELQRSLTALQP